ncbi:MAG: PD-(D/E)XK nuclease family protein [Planctomycetes bacterium]|nr:PD-(D/E)XK nuclease family protein [Planctomycetota bacterium]
MTQNTKKQKELIDIFLADNPELEELTDQLATFNVFRALKIENMEIRHSNVLGWLLDPSESHGLGDIILRRVLSNTLLLSDKTIDHISPAQVELMDFYDIEVRREWKNIDLLVIDRINKIVILIENKIHAGESKGQLAKYKKAVNEEFASYSIVPIFLTLTGYENNDNEADDYIAYSYVELLSVLEKIFNQRQFQLAEPVAVFIKHYMETLRRLTMQDDSMIELCKTIYRKHREAIDTIVKYGMKGAGQQAVEDVLSKDGDYEILYSNPTRVWFIPRTWANLIPENGTAWTHLERPVSIVIWIKFGDNKIYGRFELSKMNDAKLRLKCAENLKEAGFKLSKKAFNENATYSRFWSKSYKVTDMTDYEEVQTIIEKLLTKAKAEFPKAEKVFQTVFK